MKRALLFSFILLISISNLSAQHFAIDRLNHISGKDWNIASQGVIDSNNNLYLLGSFTDVLYIMQDTIYSKGDRDIFLVKIDSLGETLWIKTFGGEKYDNASSLVLFQNNLFVTGTFQSVMYIQDDSLSAKGYMDNFILKLDSEGNYIEGSTIETDVKENKDFLIPENQSDFYYASTFKKSVILKGDTLDAEFGDEIYIVKYSDFTVTEYNILKAYGKLQLNDFRKKDSCFYLAVNFTDSIAFPDTLYYSYGENDICIIKFDQNFNYIWSKHIAGFGKDKPKQICFDDSSNIYLVGEFSDNLYFDFDDSLNTKGITDVFAAKYNSEGDLIWFREFGGKSNDYIESMVIYNNDVYLTGSFRDTLFFGADKVISADTRSDLYISKFNTNGTYQWITNSGGEYADNSKFIIVDKDRYFYVIGNFGVNFSFRTDSLIAKTIEDASADDIFIAKFYDCDLVDDIDIVSDSVFCGHGKLIAEEGFAKYLWQNHFRRRYYNVYSSGLYTVTAIDKHKCLAKDSVYVTVYPLPQPYLGADIYSTSGTEITLDGGTFDKYEWSTGDTTRTIVVFTDSLPDYTNIFTLKVTDENNCSDSTDIAIIVENRQYSVGGGYSPQNNSDNYSNAFSGETTNHNPETTNTNPEITNTNPKISETNPEILEQLGINSESIVYPNPSSGTFTVDFTGFDDFNRFSFMIVNEEGKVFVKENNKIKNSYQYTLKRKGVYFLVIDLDNHTQIVKKIVIL